jgi:type IV pilus assembly protein PilO
MKELFGLLAGIDFQKTLIISVVLAVAFYFSPFFEDGSAIETQIVQMNSQLQGEETKKKETDASLKQVHEMQEKIGRLTSQYQEISRRLPSVLGSIEINKAIDDFGRTSGVSIKTKRPGEIAKKEIYDEVPVTVNVEGSFSELAQFVFMVSSAERMSRVRDIVIESDYLDGKARGKLKFEGVVTGYRIAPEKPKVENKL